MSKPFVYMTVPPGEFAKVRSFFDRQNAEMQGKVKNIVRGWVFDTDRSAKMMAPQGRMKSQVKQGKYPTFGTLKQKIFPAFKNDGLGGSVYVDQMVHYAPYVEFGTGKGFNRSYAHGVLKEWGVNSIQWKGQGIRQVNNTLQPFLFPAARIAKAKMYRRLEAMGFKKDGNERSE